LVSSFHTECDASVPLVACHWWCLVVDTRGAHVLERALILEGSTLLG